VTATDEITNESNIKPASSKKESSPKPQHSSEGSSIRVHITGAIKGIVRRRSNPAAVPEKNNISHALSRVQAHDITTSSNSSSRGYHSVKTFLGHIPFLRPKLKSSGKAVS
jgi:hypothetical protein